MFKYLKAISKLRCKHPFEMSEKVYKHKTGETTSERSFKFEYVVTIRKCGKCGKHFIDEGFEFCR